jgi:DNA-directed RNA polymerase specialized sigma24 family protein
MTTVSQAALDLISLDVALTDPPDTQTYSEVRQAIAVEVLRQAQEEFDRWHKALTLEVVTGFLPTPQQRVLHLTMDGYSDEEIASVEQSSPTAIRKCRSRAYRSLRKLFCVNGREEKQ